VSPQNVQPKRFSLSLTVAQWRRLAAELLAIEQEPHKTAVPVEKQLERDRAGEQVQALTSAALAQTRELADEQELTWTLPLVRTTAKYLLTACDRLRRAAVHQAWELRAQDPDALARALSEVRKWDHTMRQLSAQHGVIHPLGEMVEPLRLNESELAALGVPCDSLLNGQDLLAL
jgi:hypothetical protein